MAEAARVERLLRQRGELFGREGPALGLLRECAPARLARARALERSRFDDARLIARASEARDRKRRRAETGRAKTAAAPQSALVLASGAEGAEAPEKVRVRQLGMGPLAEEPSRAVQVRREARKGTREPVAPTWHAPWVLKRVLAGHLGWVKCVAVDPSNRFFFTGSSDCTIRCWDLASGKLKLTLTGHTHGVAGLAVSERHPYLFSAGEDKSVKCWDLETNRVIRGYHGHIQSVHCIATHPKLDVLVTGSRDASCRVWDVRTRKEVHRLTGHEDTVQSVFTQTVDPQIVTGSMDRTIRLWDLAAGKSMLTLTHHKRGVRALARHPHELSFASAGADMLKKWESRSGRLMLNLRGHDAIVNALAVNQRNVLFSGGNDGSLRFWDWSSGHCFQQGRTVPQPGSLDSEACVLAAAFDMTGSRLITCEADKSVKIWQEDPRATPETHPLQWDRAQAVQAMINERF